MFLKVWIILPIFIVVDFIQVSRQEDYMGRYKPGHSGFAHRNDQKIHLNFSEIHFCHLKVDYFGE
jgi:hypothetical protein